MIYVEEIIFSLSNKENKNDFQKIKEKLLNNKKRFIF